MKNFTKTLLTLLSLLISPLMAYAQEMWDNGAASYDCCNQYSNDQYGSGYGSNDQPTSYTSIDYSYDYAYNRPTSFGRWNGGGRGYNGGIRFGQRFDNSNNFSSGISSYQGTSTGPGPNGGYPGTPHGIYPTNYVDTSIYPNTYMENYR